MRLASVLAFALTSPLLVQPGIDAEQHFMAMEKQIVEATTLRIAFTLTVEVDEQQGKLGGDLWLGEGNKTRIEITGKLPGGKNLDMKMVCDGERMLTQTTGQQTRPPRPPPKTVGEITRGTIARAGIFAGVFYGVPEKEEPKLDDLFQLSEYKMGERQKIGAGREKLALEYKIGFRGAKERGSITVWIESPSMLPRMRHFNIHDATHKVRIVESYQEFKTGEALDPKTFDLPE